jgi:hypothetical protein
LSVFNRRKSNRKCLIQKVFVEEIRSVITNAKYVPAEIKPKNENWLVVDYENSAPAALVICHEVVANN